MAQERMSERVRDVGDGLILAFPIDEADVAGEEIDTVRLYFFRVGSETRYFERYTNLAAIAAGDTSPTSGYDYLGSTGVGSGDDVLRVEGDDWHLLHFGLAPTHPGLKIYRAVSPDANGNPAIARTGSSEDITPGTDRRGLYGIEQSDPRFDPPKFTERVSFRNSSNNTGQFLQWAFFNDDNQQLSGVELDLLLTGRGYKVQPVTHRPTQDLMLQMAMSRPDGPAIDTILHQVGGVNSYTLGSEEPDGWKTVRQSARPFTQTFNVGELPANPPGRGPPEETPPMASRR